MDKTFPQESSGPHMLPDAEVERLELLALAQAALIAHAERIERAEQDAEQNRRVA